MTDELKQWEYDRGYDKGKADMLKVIEDIKQEIAMLRDSWKTDCYYEEASALNTALNIIDKHITRKETNNDYS